MAVAKKDNNVKVAFKLLRDTAKAPEKKTDGAACWDLYTAEYAEVRNINVCPTAVKVPLGFKLFIPKGYHAKIFLRSGIGYQTNIRLANGVGIIDDDYTGEVCLLLDNYSRELIKIPAGTRVAQLLIEKNVDVVLEETTKELKETKRGSKGFGSTGKE